MKNVLDDLNVHDVGERLRESSLDSVIDRHGAGPALPDGQTPATIGPARSSARHLFQTPYGAIHHSDEQRVSR